MTKRNENLYKRLNALIDQYCEDNDLNLELSNELIDQYCEDNDLNLELSNELIDLNYEAHICNVNLLNLIKSSPRFYSEIIKFENKKLFCEMESSISKIFIKKESKKLIKEVSDLYVESCDSDKRLIDSIKSNEDLYFRLSNLKNIGSENEQSNI